MYVMAIKFCKILFNLGKLLIFPDFVFIAQVCPTLI